MKSLSSVGLALSLVFGCLFLALVAEIYYLLWWKKRTTNTDLLEEDGYTFCWNFKRTPSLRLMSAQNMCSSSSHEIIIHEEEEEDGENADSDILQSFAFGPPRFLFTIKEETKEDLESEDGKSKISKSRSRSLSDLFLHHVVETPYLTPMASPPYYTPPLTPAKGSFLHSQKGFEAEFNWLISSPPPMFKFLRDADEKLSRNNQNFQELSSPNSSSSASSSSRFLQKDEFITLFIDPEERNLQVQYPSNTSQILPLASSPPFKFS